MDMKAVFKFSLHQNTYSKNIINMELFMLKLEES